VAETQRPAWREFERLVAMVEENAAPCRTSWSTRRAGTRSMSFASCTARSSGRDRREGLAGATRCKAPRQRWHWRQCRHFGICKLQILNGPVGFESHPLRQPSRTLAALAASAGQAIERSGEGCHATHPAVPPASSQQPRPAFQRRSAPVSSAYCIGRSPTARSM
jgi:hypothetical protein